MASPPEIPFAPAPYLAPTWFQDAEHPAIRVLAARLRRDDPRQTAVACFDHVRDTITYTPCPPLTRESFRASYVLAAGVGYCVQKAVLLATLGRAAGIPSRLGFADVRNHQVSPRLREAMGTDLFVWHGFAEFHLGGRWVKATPAFDARTSEKAGVLPVSLDGQNDALFHPVDPRGAPFITYVREHEPTADLPYDAILAAIVEVYGHDKLAALEAQARGAR